MAGRDVAMTMGHYLRSMRQLADQHTPSKFRKGDRQRLYLKDVDCPKEWHDALETIIHPIVFYLNENVTSCGSRSDETAAEDTLAPAGDLMSSLPPDMRAENLMCYIGHEGTYTPAHREMCASLGQNIMVEASGSENGEKPGSSIWFMTETKDREVVREYFLSMLGHDIEIENHFAQINAWKRANFDVHVVEQQPGDFILVPPLAAHQVWNRGTRTMKVAWNRTTVETLSMALDEALPKARLVCRDEQYKNKALVYYTMGKYAKLLTPDEKSDIFERWNLPFRKAQVADNFKVLFGLFTTIILSEMLHTEERDIERIPFGSYITCSFCRGNIFNRFLTCKHCIRKTEAGEDDTYDVCMECYTMGRSCACISELSWCEQWDWSELVANYEEWRGIVIANDGYVDVEASPQPIEVVAQRMARKSLARICQEELKRRSGKDLTLGSARLNYEEDSNSEKTPTQRGQNRRRQKTGNVANCHVCSHKEYIYKMAKCSNIDCNEAYCYGSLYRAFDEMPVVAMENENWQCPKCRNICYCGSCRRTGTSTYTPTKTCLGYDTLKIADDRSVEALVNFRLHNFSWIKAVGEESRSQHSRRMLQLRAAADNTKADDDASTFVAEVESLSIEAAQIQYAAHLQAHALPSIASSSAQADLLAHAVGLGYFDEEDEIDRILFDPYQEERTETVLPYSERLSYTHSQGLQTSGENTGEQVDSMMHFVSSSPLKPADTVASEPECEPLQSMDPALFNEPPPPVVEPEVTETHGQKRLLIASSRACSSDSGIESPPLAAFQAQGDDNEEIGDAPRRIASPEGEESVPVTASHQQEENMPSATIDVPEDAQLVSDDNANHPMGQESESPEPVASPETPNMEVPQSSKRSVSVDTSKHTEASDAENRPPHKYQKLDAAAEEPESVQSSGVTDIVGQGPLTLVPPTWFGMLPRTRRPQSESDTSDDDDIPAKILSAEEIEQAKLAQTVKATQLEITQSYEDGEIRARGRGRGRARGAGTARASGRGRGRGASRGTAGGSSSRGRGRGRGRGGRGSRARGSRDP